MTGRFSVHLTPSFLRDLDKLPKAMQATIGTGLSVLESNPFGPPPRIRKLRGKGHGRYRLRIGAYRVRYDIDGGKVILLRVRHRRDVYR